MPITSRDMPIDKLLGKSDWLQIPLYQRQYKWGKDNWSDLFSDVTSNNYVPPEEAATFSYFIGTLILIGDPLSSAQSDVVDGQQRLTTISLWLTALRYVAHDIHLEACKVLKHLKGKQKQARKVLDRPVDEVNAIPDEQERLAAFKQREQQQQVDSRVSSVMPVYEALEEKAKILIASIDSLLFGTKEPKLLRLRLGKQNKDNEAYEALLTRIVKPLAEKLVRPKVLKTETRNHVIYKAFTHFVREYSDAKLGIGEVDGDLGAGLTVAPKRASKRLNAIITRVAEHLGHLQRLGAATVIATDDISAYMLFEGLNYRAEPLSTLDLLKNHLLSHIDRGLKERLEDACDRWTEMAGLIPAQMQPNFLRHAYLAFPTQFKNHEDSITESQVLRQYKANVIDGQSAWNMNEFLLKQAKSYSGFADPTTLLASHAPIAAELDVLCSASAKPAGVLLIKLLSPERINEAGVAAVIVDLQRFFVRRHLTSEPRTQDLEGIMVDLSKKLDGLSVEEFRKTVLQPALQKLTSLKDALKELCFVGSDQSSRGRAILAMYEYSRRAPEDRPLLCAKDGNKSAFTLEHVLPQTPSKEWKNDLVHSGVAEADVTKVHELYLNFIGNLTLTRFNTKLSNKQFQHKRDAKEKEDYIGYRNGLKLNEALATWTEWTTAGVLQRGVDLVSGLSTVLAFPGESDWTTEEIRALVEERLQAAESLDDGDWGSEQDDEEDAEDDELGSEPTAKAGD